METKECILPKKENKNTIKKVEINTESLQNAIKISQNIKINEKYEPNFSYILKNQSITKSELKQDEISSCELTEENYILCKYRDIGSETIFDFLSKNIENTNIIRYILDFHTLLVESLKELNKTGIVDLDIREENIIITNEQIPVIINFTQAINKPDLKLKGKSNPNWCIEAIIYEKIEDMDSNFIIQPGFFESLNIESENQSIDEIKEKMIGKTIEDLKKELESIFGL